MAEKTMTVWVTKYALGGHIIETQVTVGDDHTYAYPVAGSRLRHWTGLKMGRDAFDTLEGAQADVEVRRKKRIASLRKQIATVEKAQPTVVVNQPLP